MTQNLPAPMVRAPLGSSVLVPAIDSDQRWVRMADNDPEMHRLNELERRLQRARGGQREKENKPAPRAASPSQMGIAFRLITELLAGVIVGGAIGWALDRVFGTSPILLIVCFLTGVAAGIRNVQRAAREMNEKNAGKD